MSLVWDSELGTLSNLSVSELTVGEDCSTDDSAGELDQSWVKRGLECRVLCEQLVRSRPPQSVIVITI